jgi:hypothetical protein
MLENKQTIGFNQNDFIFNSKEISWEKNIKVPTTKVTSLEVSYGISLKLLLVWLGVMFLPFFIEWFTVIAIVLPGVIWYFLYFSKTIKIEIVTDWWTKINYELWKSLIENININSEQSNILKDKLFKLIK